MSRPFAIVPVKEPTVPETPPDKKPPAKAMPASLAFAIKDAPSALLGSAPASRYDLYIWPISELSPLMIRSVIVLVISVLNSSEPSTNDCLRKFLTNAFTDVTGIERIALRFSNENFSKNDSAIP